MTGQERQDVHDQMKIFTIEVSDILSLNVREKTEKITRNGHTQDTCNIVDKQKNQHPSHLCDHSAFLLIRTTYLFEKLQIKI